MRGKKTTKNLTGQGLSGRVKGKLVKEQIKSPGQRGRSE